jgi:hypothetical protein
MTDKNKAFSTSEAVGRYLALMHELATRVELVARICDGHLDLPLPFAREFVYLQFRHICELIALGCLQLHGDIPETQTQAAKSEWNADKMMKLLQRSYAHSFPQCVERSQTAVGTSIKANGKPNALTYSDFKKLYGECGDALHRGTIRSIQTSRHLTQADYDAMVAWQGKIVDLMNEHLVGRANGTGIYLISLRTDSGYPECSILTKNGEAKMDVSNFKMKIGDAGYEDLMLVGNMKLSAAS